MKYEPSTRRMYEQGLLFGFISKDKSEEILTNLKLIPTSFIIYMSEEIPGAFTVAFVPDIEERVVRYVLIELGELTPRRTLADIIQSKHSFTIVVRYINNDPTKNYRLENKMHYFKAIVKPEGFSSYL